MFRVLVFLLFCFISDVLYSKVFTDINYGYLSPNPAYLVVWFRANIKYFWICSHLVFHEISRTVFLILD